MKQKIEITADYIRIPNPKFSGECDDIKTIDIQPNSGIRALWCVGEKRVKTYLFDKDKWGLEEAKEWVSENAKEVHEMYTKAKVNVKEDEGEKVFTAIASAEVEDREGDIVEVDGWDYKAYIETNPVLLWAHNRSPGHDGLPIGKVTNIVKKVRDGVKELLIEFEITTITEFGRTVRQFVEDGILNTLSVGFRPLEREGNRVKKQELLEISIVPVPALAQAQIISRAKDLNVPVNKALKIVEERGVVSYEGYKKSPESTSWDAGDAINRGRVWAGGPKKDDIDWNDYKELFTWYNQSEEGKSESYKLPHHDVVDGKLVTVWRGVAGAMAILLGARGGVDLPQGERKRVYEHLVKHYEQFDKEPPEYKMVEKQILKDCFDQMEKEITKEHYRDTKKHIQYMVSEVRKNEKKRLKELKKKEKEAKKLKKTLIEKDLLDTLSVVKEALKQTNN